MPKVFKEYGEPVVGALVIDWVKRTAVYSGMQGGGFDEFTPEDVDKLIAENAGNPDVEVQPLIFWKDQDQLSAHDAGSWSGQFEENDEEEESDDAY